MVEETAGAPLNRQLLSRKTKNSMGGVLDEGASSGPSDFAMRMLTKFGWKAGEGLGKNKDGMKSHIRVKQRADNLGLGADAKKPSEWAPPPKATTAAAGSGSDSDSDSEDEAEAAVKRRIGGSGVVPGMSDEDLFKLCGGARLGMRARANQGGKQRRMEEADRRLAEMKKAADAAAQGTGADAAAPAAKRQRSDKAAEPERTTAAGDDADKAARKAARKEARKAERKAAKKAEKKAAKKAAKKAPQS